LKSHFRFTSGEIEFALPGIITFNYQFNLHTWANFWRIPMAYVTWRKWQRTGRKGSPGWFYMVWRP